MESWLEFMTAFYNFWQPDSANVFFYAFSILAALSQINQVFVMQILK